MPSSTWIQVRTRSAPTADLVDEAGEGPVEDDGHAVGVVPQVGELVGAVAVVGVDRDQTGVQRAHRHDEVLGAVVEVDAHLVLELGAALGERRAERVDRREQLAVADLAVALADRDRVRQRRARRTRAGPRSSSLVITAPSSGRHDRRGRTHRWHAAGRWRTVATPARGERGDCDAPALTTRARRFARGSPSTPRRAGRSSRRGGSSCRTGPRLGGSTPIPPPSSRSTRSSVPRASPVPSTRSASAGPARRSSQAGPACSRTAGYPASSPARRSGASSSASRTQAATSRRCAPARCATATSGW